MTSVIRSATRAWAEAWGEPGFRLRLALTLAALVGTLALLARFLDYVERRPGAVLADPLLALLPPQDLTWLTFGLIYAGLFFGVARLLTAPLGLVVALEAYVVMVLLRIVALWITPLEAPPGMIPLHDPLVRLFGPGKLLTKDLFFSGHTSTLFLLALVVPGRRSKALFLFCTAAVGACVLWQHVHYTIDVLAAPLFAWASTRLVFNVRRERAGSGRGAAPRDGR
ncbi:MAG TPA: phosphatase PAP2-related protein [Thermoanaerobaculia bacterium]|nr:phosphatase PAP2-related protein [Thermoanaerobaculia bacterium]